MIKLLLIVFAGIVTMSAKSQVLVLNNSRTPSHQSLRNIKLSLIPPRGFVPLPDDRGFFQRGTEPENGGPQIIANKFQVDFSHFRQPLDTVTGTIGKVNVDLVLDNSKHFSGLWFKKVYTLNGRTFTSLTFAFGSTIFSYLLTGFFTSTDAAIEAIVQQSMQSAYIDLAGYPSALARNGVAVSAITRTEHLDLANTNYKLAEAPTDDWSIYTQDGIYPSQLSDKSFLQVRRTSALVSESARERYSLQLLNEYTEFNSVTQVQRTAVPIDELQGIELAADAKSTDTGSNVKIIQMTLFDPEKSNVWIIIGLAYSPTMINVQRAISRTFKK